MRRLGGGSDTGAGEPPGVDVLTGEILSERGIWNDHTQAYEIYVASRSEKTHGLVQQRYRSREFAREYESYHAAAAAGGAARRLRGGDDDPADDSEGDMGGYRGGPGSERLDGDLR